MSTLVARDTVSAAVLIYPLHDDGRLVDTPRAGQLLAEDGSEFELTMPGDRACDQTSLLIGVRQANNARAFLGVEVVLDRAANGGRVVNAVRGGIGERVLAEEGRQPVLHGQRYRYQWAFSDEVYASWQSAGILHKTTLDRILLCPHCSALPTFRFGCARCRSGRILQTVLVHHFACACVLPLDKFSGGESLRCPKCQTRHLIAGTDFEYAPGEYECQDCGWKSRDLTQVGHCLQCESRFPIHQAVEQEVVGFHVDRVDPMAFIPHAE